MFAIRSVETAWSRPQDPESLIAMTATTKMEMAAIQSAKLNLGSAAAEGPSTSQTSALRSVVMDSISASRNVMTVT